MWLRAFVVGATFVACFWLERRRPLRQPVAPLGSRAAGNLALALPSALVLATGTPLIRRLSRWTMRRRAGLVHLLPLPRVVRDLTAVALLDYTLYVWHVLNHRVPALWRFHGAHHLDRDLDTLTGLRFHYAEMLLSVPWRAAQVVVIGASPRALSSWQTLTFASILFHHSNVRLPEATERVLGRVLVTPRMHGIHHSARKDERNSNWSSAITSLWDRVHGTLRLDVPQSQVTIGLPPCDERRVRGFEARSEAQPKRLAEPHPERGSGQR